MSSLKKKAFRTSNYFIYASHQPQLLRSKHSNFWPHRLGFNSSKRCVPTCRINRKLLQQDVTRCRRQTPQDWVTRRRNTHDLNFCTRKNPRMLKTHTEQGKYLLFPRTEDVSVVDTAFWDPRELHFLIQEIRRPPHPQNLRFTDTCGDLTEPGKSSSVTRPRAGGSWLDFEARGISQTRHGNQVGSPRGRPWDRKRQGSCSWLLAPNKVFTATGKSQNHRWRSQASSKSGGNKSTQSVTTNRAAQVYLWGPQCGGVNTVLRLNCTLWNWCLKEATLGECYTHEDASGKIEKETSAVRVGPSKSRARETSWSMAGE